MSNNSEKLDLLVLSIATNQFKVPLPTGREIITAVNERGALLSEVAQLRGTVRWMLNSGGAYLFHESECPWQHGSDDSCNCRVLKARELAK